MKHKTFVAASAFLLALAGTALGQMAETPKPISTPMSTGSEMSVSGAVITSNSTELVVNSDAGQRMTFVLDDKTNPSRSFNTGERVSVRYHAMTSGTSFHAAGVALEPMAKVETQGQTTGSARVEPPSYGTASAEPSRLPDTASSFPLLALLGFVALSGAVLLRSTRA